MGKKSTPPPPDYGPLADASRAQAEAYNRISMEQLAWSREQDAANREILKQVLDTQLPAMQNQADWAQADRQRYEDVVLPLQDSLVKDFQGYGGPDRMQFERGRAISDVNAQFDAQRRNALSRLESYGVDPSQSRNAALDINMRTAQAAAAAGAGTAASVNVEDKARALRADALNVMSGLPSQAAASYGQAVNAGSAGIGGANNTFATGAGAMGNPTSWGNMSMQGYNQAGNLMNMGFGNQMQAYNARQAAAGDVYGAIGGIAGMATSFMADGGPALPVDGMGDVVGPGDGSGIDDRVPALLSTGEYVIPADVVNKKGSEFFDRLVDKYHTPAAQQRGQGLPMGGRGNV